MGSINSALKSLKHSKTFVEVGKEGRGNKTFSMEVVRNT